ncbi:MAG: helix-turn-helix transcriptional regulator [Acidimicrobiales bacterium]
MIQGFHPSRHRAPAHGRLTALREQAGLSQRELAQRIGVSQPRVAAIERSRHVTIDVLE